MAIGRAYRIKKNAVKAYGYTRPPKKRALKRNGSVTHIAAINGRGSYRSARRTMSGLSANRRPAAARSSLSAAKKSAFARKMRAAKGKGSRFSKNAPRVRRVMPNSRRRLRRNDVSPAQERIWERAASRHRDPWGPSPRKRKRKAKPKRKAAKPKSRRRAAPKKATRKKPMARKVRRRKKSAARKPVKRRRVAKRRTIK